MKITDDVRKYAAEQGIADEKTLERWMLDKATEFTTAGRRDLREMGSACFQRARFGILPKRTSFPGLKLLDS